MPVDPDEVMPNPARRRMDVVRRAASVREGDGRNKLVRFAEDDPRYAEALRQVAEAILTEQEIDALRPSVPKYARVGDTELAGKLTTYAGTKMRARPSQLERSFSDHLRRHRRRFLCLDGVHAVASERARSRLVGHRGQRRSEHQAAGLRSRRNATPSGPAE
jgi:hypothetical protein